MKAKGALMSDMELDPHEIAYGGEDARDRASVTVIEPRDVPLGGVRAMNVRRTLPHRTRRTIGAWCFLDHYGPDNVLEHEGMFVPPHPHTGLQTVSWLFRGEIEHRDALGSHQLIAPGEMNLMTAGYGISHSEVSTERDPVLHGVQLWVVLPKAERHAAPAFSHTVAKRIELDARTGAAELFVFMGELAGARAKAQGMSELVGAEILLPAGGELTLDLDPRFEYGVLVDSGDVRVNGVAVSAHALGVIDVGETSLALTAGDEDARLLLIGGEPLREEFVMWWNFIGDTHDEVVAAREAWMTEVVEREGSMSTATRFVDVPGFDGPPLPAPRMPNTRLKPR